MKSKVHFLQFTLLMLAFIVGKAQKTYEIIPKKTGKVNQKLAAGLPPSLRALAAFYSAMGGTNCMEMECTLTTALGLGKQGSDAQKALILKYFPDDKAAKLVIGQDCYLPPGSATSFSNFWSLSFSVNGENIRVNYELAVYDHGNTKMIKGPDIYYFKNNVFKNTKRVLYAWTDK
jgi:hypothetical protein